MRIIYFDLDSTRQDHLGIYGYNRETSRNIDKLAENALIFNNCYVSDAPCLPSRAALFSCRPGIANGVISHETPGCNFRFPAKMGQGRYYPEYEMPMRLLQLNDYHTVTTSVFAQRHCAWWFNAGFSEVLNPTRPCNSEDSDSINPRLIKWMNDNVLEYENLFLHVNYWDAHTFYHPDMECRNKVAAHSTIDWPNDKTIKDHCHSIYGPKTARDIMIRREHEDYVSADTSIMPNEIKSAKDLKVMNDSYDGSIATADKAIGEVVSLLKELGIYEETAIIISADHGEAIGQLGMYYEHGVCVDGVNRVPLIFKWQNMSEQKFVDGFLYQHDFMATIMDLLNINIPEKWDAKSFKQALYGDGYKGLDSIVCGCGIFTMQRMVRTKEYALIKTLHPGCYPYDDKYLFDMIHDKNQMYDIKKDNKEIVDRLEGIYADWWSSWCTGYEAVRDPMYEQIHSFEYYPVEKMRKKLRYDNRLEQMNDLDQRVKQSRRTYDDKGSVTRY